MLINMIAIIIENNVKVRSSVQSSLYSQFIVISIIFVLISQLSWTSPSKSVIFILSIIITIMFTTASFATFIITADHQHQHTVVHNFHFRNGTVLRKMAIRGGTGVVIGLPVPSKTACPEKTIRVCAKKANPRAWVKWNRGDSAGFWKSRAINVGFRACLDWLRQC